MAQAKRTPSISPLARRRSIDKIMQVAAEDTRRVSGGMTRELCAEIRRLRSVISRLRDDMDEMENEL